MFIPDLTRGLILFLQGTRRRTCHRAGSTPRPRIRPRGPATRRRSRRHQGTRDTSARDSRSPMVTRRRMVAITTTATIAMTTTTIIITMDMVTTTTLKMTAA